MVEWEEGERDSSATRRAEERRVARKLPNLDHFLAFTTEQHSFGKQTKASKCHFIGFQTSLQLLPPLPHAQFEFSCFAPTLSRFIVPDFLP